MDINQIKYVLELLKSSGGMNFVGKNNIAGFVEKQFNISSDKDSDSLLDYIGMAKNVEKHIETIKSDESYSSNFKYFRQFFKDDFMAECVIYQLSRFSSFDNVLNYIIVEQASNTRLTCTALKSPEMYDALVYFSQVEKEIGDSYYPKKVEHMYNECHPEMAVAQKGVETPLCAGGQK